MKSICFLTDVLFHSPKQGATNHSWLFKLLEPIITSVAEVRVSYFSDNVVDTSEDVRSVFNRNHFFELSGIDLKKYENMSYVAFDGGGYLLRQKIT